MKYPRFLYFLGLVVIGSLLSGCVGPTLDPPIDIPQVLDHSEFDLEGEENYILQGFDDDIYPLFVGARWLYRNAANFWNPQIAGSGLLESEVVAIVRGEGVECYVLRTHYSNGPDELLYLHRTKNRVFVHDVENGAAAGAQTSFSLDPGLPFLEFPIEEDKTWPLFTTEGVGSAYVYHPEVAAIESGEVRTMLGTYSPIFVDAWRVHYNLPISAPRLYGGPVQFLWFAPGVGVVKHVLNSVDYELAEFRLPEEVTGLERRDDGRTKQVPRGGLVVVQLREGEGWEWGLAEVDGEELQYLSDEFFADAPRVFDETGAGTRTFQFRATAAGEVGLLFELRSLASDRVRNGVEYTVEIE